MNLQLPSVAECANHLRLGGQVLIFAIFHIALVHKWLKIAAVLDAVRRVHINTLHLAAHPFFLQQRVHHQQTITSDKAVAPVVAMLVELHRFPQRRIFFRRCKELVLCTVGRAVAFLYHLNNRARLNAFMHMQRNCLHLKRSAFRFSCPLQRGVKVRVISPFFWLAGIWVGLRRHQSHWRVVHSLFALVLVGLNLFAFFGGHGSWGAGENEGHYMADGRRGKQFGVATVGLCPDEAGFPSVASCCPLKGQY